MPFLRAVPFLLSLSLSTACGGEAKKSEPEVKAEEPKKAEDYPIAKRRAGFRISLGVIAEQ